MNRILRLLVVLCLALPVVGRGQVDGTLDTTFSNVGSGGSTIQAIEIQSDHKIIIGGQFELCNDYHNRCEKIARLDQNGNFDTTFNYGLGFNGYVYVLKLQPDGKILAGGNFTTFDGVSRSRIVRLTRDGFLDTTFNPGTGFNAKVSVIALQPDGKILVGGEYSLFNGVSRKRLTRLNENGSLDTTYNTGELFNGHITDLHFLPDGKLLTVSRTSRFNSPYRRLIRLHANGDLDTTFKFGMQGVTGSIDKIAFQSDGRIIAIGDLLGTGMHGFWHGGILRYFYDGTLDTTFRMQGGLDNTATSVVIQPDDKIVVGGWFNQYESLLRNNFVRLNANGTLDQSFDTGEGFDRDNFVLCIYQQQNEKLLVAGYISHYNGRRVPKIVRLNNTPVITKALRHYVHNLITLSPNPAHRTVSITAARPLQSVRLVGMDGKAVRSFSGGAGAWVLELTGVPAGLYVVEGTGVDGCVERQRLVVE